MKTVTIERYHCFGTGRYELRAMYCGATLRWSEGNGVTAFAQCIDGGDVSLRNMVETAKRFGFTHARYVGDWGRRTKPKNGKL